MNKILISIFKAFVCNLAIVSIACAVSIPEVSTSKTKVEIVFVLDTTGSMGGLIAAAKEKIWSIAQSLAKAQPAPEIRIGLVGYRDRGDQYVTKVTDLTSNLDSLYEQLMAFSADGGGDGPESVNQALFEAIKKISWSKDEKTYRTIFLVGDAPPHMDYQDDQKYPETITAALKQGILINTIQCGSMVETTPIWKEIALKGEGNYFAVAQNGGAVASASPYDADLARLSAEVDRTRLVYGNKLEQQAQSDRFEISSKIAASAPAAAVAGRSALNATEAGAANWLGSKELINDVVEGKATLSKLSDEELPEPVRNLPKEKREEFIKEQNEKRIGLQKQIRDLSEKRQEYLKAEVKKSGGGESSLDAKLFETVKEQAKKKSILLGEGPTY